MDETLKQILTELQGLKDGQEKLNQRFDSMEKQMDGLADKLLEKIDQVAVEIKSEIRHVANTQEEQRNVIDLLSSRSIQHEAALKRKN